MKETLAVRRFWILPFVLLFIFTNSALAERTAYADQGGIAVFMEDGKVGLVDSHGDVILPAEYDKIGGKSLRALDYIS